MFKGNGILEKEHSSDLLDVMVFYKHAVGNAREKNKDFDSVSLFRH